MAFKGKLVRFFLMFGICFLVPMTAHARLDTEDPRMPGFPRDPAFAASLVIPLDQTLPAKCGDQSFSMTVGGVQLLFQTTSSTGLFSGVFGSCVPGGPPGVLSAASAPVVITINPPVSAVGLIGVGAECLPFATFVGSAGTESGVVSWPFIGANVPAFIGAADLGGISTVTLKDAFSSGLTCTPGSAAWSQIRFVPAGGITVPTSTSIVSLSNPAVFGQPVTLTATVSPTASAATAPTGTVNFFDGTSLLGAAALTGGNPDTASFKTATLAVGSHSLSAVYQGDTNFTVSTSDTLSQTVNRAFTTTSVFPSVDPSQVSQSVTYTAIATTTPPGSGIPTGTFAFSDSGVPIAECASVPATGGQATCEVTYSSVGSHTITATYSGDINFSGSTSPALGQSVARCATTLTGCNLAGAQLSGANLFRANLSGSNLKEATLAGANLISANVAGANLKASNLAGGNLLGADLSGANLKGATLQAANVVGANMSGANLKDANATGASLAGVNLAGANVKDVTWTNTTCPDGTLSDTAGGTCLEHLGISFSLHFSSIREFLLPTAGSEPLAITAGPDGALWFTETTTNRIGRMDPITNQVTEFDIPTPASSPSAITVGPDGALWFTELNANQIGRFDPTTLKFAEFTIPTVGGAPWDIVAGPDGNLWFTEFNGNHIGRIPPTGQPVDEFAIPTPGSGPRGITAGPDGNLWFTELSVHKIGRVGPNGGVIEFPISAPSGPFFIRTGPDGALWFTTGGGIGRMSTTGQETEFSVPSSFVVEWITAGPDGNLWFTDIGSNLVGRITPTGQIAEFSIPTAGSEPAGITVGPDGNIWFTELLGNAIGRIIPDMRVTTLPATAGWIAAGADGNLWFTDNLPGIGHITPKGAVTLLPGPAEPGGLPVSSGPRGITLGPDGNLWFADCGVSVAQIWRVTSTGQLASFPVPTASSCPQGITVGPDGNLWFTELGANQIGRISPTGEAITEFSIPTHASDPVGITSGPDGNLWFTEQVANQIGRITPTGQVTEFPIPTPVPTSGTGPNDITVGSDGNLWFTEISANQIGRITPSGQITEYPVPTTRSSPWGITAGPDGNLWFTERGAAQIGRITPAGQITEFAAPACPSPCASFPFEVTTGPDGSLWITDEAGSIVRMTVR